jgi:hypothetical protein
VSTVPKRAGKAFSTPQAHARGEMQDYPETFGFAAGFFDFFTEDKNELSLSA